MNLFSTCRKLHPRRLIYSPTEKYVFIVDAIVVEKPGSNLMTSGPHVDLKYYANSM